jgi:hypothetical protein
MRFSIAGRQGSKIIQLVTFLTLTFLLWVDRIEVLCEEGVGRYFFDTPRLREEDYILSPKFVYLKYGAAEGAQFLRLNI